MKKGRIMLATIIGIVMAVIFVIFIGSIFVQAYGGLATPEDKAIGSFYRLVDTINARVCIGAGFQMKEESILLPSGYKIHTDPADTLLLEKKCEGSAEGCENGWKNLKTEKLNADCNFRIDYVCCQSNKDCTGINTRCNSPLSITKSYETYCIVYRCSGTLGNEPPCYVYVWARGFSISPTGGCKW